MLSRWAYYDILPSRGTTFFVIALDTWATSDNSAYKHTKKQYEMLLNHGLVTIRK